MLTITESGVVKKRTVQWNEQTAFDGTTAAGVVSITDASLLVDAYASLGVFLWRKQCVLLEMLTGIDLWAPIKSQIVRHIEHNFQESGAALIGYADMSAAITKK